MCQRLPNVRFSNFTPILVAVIVTAGSVSQGGAEEASSPTEKAKHYSQLFDKICYSTLPDMTPIMRLAKKDGWTPITGKALEAYAPEVPPDQLKAWSFTDSGAELKISISSGPVDDTLKSVLPAFANARASACSLILPGQVPQKALEPALNALVGRGADETYPQDPFNVHLWSGVTEELAALLYYYRPKSGRPGGLISFVVLKK